MPSHDHRPPSAAAALDNCLSSIDLHISPSLSSDRPLWFDPAECAAFLDALNDRVATIHDFTPLAQDTTNKAAAAAVAAGLDRAEDLLQQALFFAGDGGGSGIGPGGSGGEGGGGNRGFSSGDSYPSD